MKDSYNHITKMPSIDELSEELQVELRRVNVVVHPNKELDIPEIEYTRYSEVAEELDILRRLLTEWYIITDSFEDHSLRREWRTEMKNKFGSEFSEFYEKNKLRGNWVFITYTQTKDIHTEYPSIPRLDISNAGYKDMILHEKIEYIHKTEDKVVKFLYQFAKDK